MGYRGEDVPRDRTDSRRQQPWQQPSATRPAAEEQWSGPPRGYGQANDGYATGGYDGYRDAYAGYEGYAQDGEYGEPGGYGQGGGYGSGYERNDGYGPGSGGQYGSGGEYEYGANGAEYGADSGYGQNYEYGHGYGGQPGYDDGNDWYGSQAPLTGGFAAVRDPVRGFPPAPGQPAFRPQLPAAPPQLPAARPQLPAAPRELEAAPYTGQLEVYDESRYETYPGYEGVTETEEPQGYGPPQDYDDAPGYNSTQAYGTGGYDTDEAEQQMFAAAPTYDEAVGYDQQDYDDYDYDDGTPEGGQPGKTPKGGKRRRSRVLLSVAGVVVLAAAAGYTFIIKPKQPANNDSAIGPLPSPGATSSATAACQAQLGQYCHIELRTDDPKPPTLAELYPPQFFNEVDHTSFIRVGTRLDKNCANAVIGPDLVSALQDGKCTQALRASYVSGDHKIMGTIGVINLSTTNEAHHAGKVVGANDFISPLSVAHGPGNNIGQGTGVVQAEFKGHYLILTWAEFSTLKAPTTNAQDTALVQFQNDLISGTADISLSQRMVNGQPATTAG